ncbi:MAG: hypothetical protein AB8G05_18610 [Oligoflexales bacterium]
MVNVNNTVSNIVFLIFLLFGFACSSAKMRSADDSKKVENTESGDIQGEVVKVIEKDPAPKNKEDNKVAPIDEDSSSSEVLKGEISSTVNGFYDNEKWNELVLKIDSSNNVRGTYNYRKGTLTGKYDPDTGKVTAWWCEVDKNNEKYRAKSEDDYGEAEFVFEGDKTGNIDLIGKWRYGTSGNWIEDWNLTLINDPNTKQIEIKDELEGWFDQEDYFCFRP